MSKNGSKRSFIDSVEVKSPCSEDWDDMKGNAKVRFCSHCAKDVNNLSEMTRKEASRLVHASGGKMCIRYMLHPVTRRPVFAEQLLQLTRSRPRLTAGVVSASIVLGVRAYGQESIPAETIPKPVQEAPTRKAVEPSAEARKPVSKLTGTIYDPVGAVIPNVRLSLTNLDNKSNLTTVSDSDGRYAFDTVPEGRFELTAIGANGFASKTISGVDLYDGHDAMVDVIQEPEARVFLGGVVAMVEYSSPLASAIADEDIDSVRELLAQGANVNAKEDDYNKITPLFVAVETGNLEIVQLLLDFGAKVNARDEEKQTPLMRLDYDATPELVEILVRNGAKLNLTDKESNTALIAGTDNGIKAPVVEALIRAGADVRLANKEGTTALMNAANRDDLESVKLLVEAGADVNAKDDEGETAWDKTSDEEIEQYLVGHGAIVEIDEDPGDGETTPDQ